MNKFIVKSRLPKRPGRQAGSFRPHVETLECRAQPGSMLSAAGSLLASAALDLNAGIEVTMSRVNQELVAQRRLAPESDLPKHVRPTDQNASGTREAAPIQAAPATAAPLPVSAPSHLSIQDQARAISARPTLSDDPLHPAYTLSQAPMTSQTPALLPGHPLALSQIGGTFQTTALAPESFRTVTAAISPQAPRLQPIASPKIIARNDYHAPPPGGATIVTSYLGTADGESHVKAIRANPAGDGSAFVTGYLTDPNTGAQDAYVARISADGSSDQPMLIAADPSGVNNWQGSAIDVGSDGAIYVAGTISSVDNSRSQMFLMRIARDVQTMDWIISPTLGGALDQGNGARIGFDPNLGECLYATGAFQNPNPNQGNAELAVVRVSNLGPDPTQLQVEGQGFKFRDPNHALANTLGNNIGVDPSGNMLIAASLGYHDGNDRTALVVGVPADFSIARGREIAFNTNGPTNGSYNSVDVDAHGEVYLAGQLDVIPQEGSPHSALLLSALTFDGRKFTSIYTTLSGNFPDDWVGTGNKAIGNARGGAGDQAINSTLSNPNDPMSGANILMRVSPDGDMSIDRQLIGVTGGSRDDESTGLDVQADPLGEGNDYYMAGYTNSTDFSTTANAFQPHDPDSTGAFYEGWVAEMQITPF